MKSLHPYGELTELHAHLGTSISPAIYWHIANSEGYKLPKRDYHEFINHITLSPASKMSLKEYLDQIYHPILDKLSSGAMSLEKGTYECFSGAYRASNITILELRMNPMKHNRDGEVDLDHAIMAMLRGMEKALLEYPKLHGGLIFCLDRQFTYEKNQIIVEKAIKYHHRGVVGIDFANYIFQNHNPFNFHIKDYVGLVEKARAAGLKITVHAGEAHDANDDMWDCVRYLNPDRIGHGVMAVQDTKLLKELAERKIVLEVCPMSNLMTKAIANDQELASILHSLIEHSVKFTINTDWPEMIRDAHLANQYAYLDERNILTKEQIQQTITWAREATFIPIRKETNLYL